MLGFSFRSLPQSARLKGTVGLCDGGVVGDAALREAGGEGCRSSMGRRLWR